MQINNINPSISFYNSFVPFISCAVKKSNKFAFGYQLFLSAGKNSK